MADTPLTQAILKNDAGRFYLLLEATGGTGLEVREVDGYRRTPLQICIWTGNAAFAGALIQAGADVNAQEHKESLHSGKSCLHQATISYPNAEIARLLIEKGADIHEVNYRYSGGAPLVNSVFSELLFHRSRKTEYRKENYDEQKERAYIDVLRLLMESGARLDWRDNSSWCHDYRETMLYRSIGKGLTEVTALLLKHKANPDIRSEDGDTPLMLAVQKNDLQAVKLIVENGADLNLRQKKIYDKPTALTCALEWGNKSRLEIARYLLEKGAIPCAGDAYTAAALIGDTDLALRMIDSGINLGRAREGFVLLAARTNDKVLLSGLIARNVQVNERSFKWKQTPLMLAAVNGYTEIAQMLIKAGAKISLADKEGNTALSLAQAEGHEDIVCLLRNEPLPQPGFREVKRLCDDLRQQLGHEALTEIIAGGDVSQIREHYNRGFWQDGASQPKWGHLKLSLLREDKPMMRFLITWGAQPSAEELLQLKGELPEKYAHYVTLLRQCGLSRLKLDFDASAAATPQAGVPDPQQSGKPRPPSIQTVLKT